MRELLEVEDYGPLLDYETAIVLAADELGARVFFAAHGEQSIGFDAVEWAAPFITTTSKGPAPTTVADVLKPGDVVRFRRTAEGGWRLAQIPEVQGAFVSIDPFDGAIIALERRLRLLPQQLQPSDAGAAPTRLVVQAVRVFGGVRKRLHAGDGHPRRAARRRAIDATLERVWRPENFGGKYFGQSRLREALYESMNAVSIKLVQGMGVPAAVQHVKRFGFDDAAVPNDLSLALGAGSVAPVAVAAGYATFANGGYKVTPYFIDRVTTADGEVLYESKPLICPECNTPPETPVEFEPVTPELVSDVTELYPKQRAAPRIISAQNSYLISDMLRDVVTRGSGTRALELGRRDLAGKTGTTNEGSRYLVRRLQRRCRRRGLGGIRSIPPARRRLAGWQNGDPHVDRLHARGTGRYSRATAATAAGHRRGANQPDERPDRRRWDARQHLREVRHRPLAGP